MWSLLSLALISGVGADQPGGGRRLNVLFLGHKPDMHPGHATQERFMDLLQGLGPRGVDLDFVEEPASALRPEKLAFYDALIIYANWEKITPEQEKALFDYVESGHGFVPIHCASYCFLNSMRYTQLIGARFQRHGTGEFDVVTTPAGAEHELLKGFQPFRTWDETYVHTLHNEDKLVLQRRVEPEAKIDEPWTWVREHGKGRVFYTAYGHNERTWTQPGFHDLIYRGLIWAVGPKAAAEHAALVLPPLTYEPGTENIVPNYEKRTPAPLLQHPLSPEESAARISIPAGLKLDLFASEKDGLWNVIEFKFDARGRMWTCESLDYPNERKPQGEGRDRIRILEDKNGDGKVDVATIFAEKLSIPTSLVFANDGVIVHNLPDTTFLKDTDGDNHADERRVLFTGWGVGDTHACPSNMAYGFDGWVYGAVGYSGFNGTVGTKAHKFGQGIYRFKPDGSELEYLGRTSNNTWGFAFNENGDLFGSTANGQSSFYCPIPLPYYAGVPGLEQGILEGIDANRRAPYMRSYVRQVDVMGGFTAAACHNFYTARSFPPEYWNSIAFVAEPTCHLLYQAVVKPKGSTFTAGNGMNLIASDDEWFAPVYAETGPDGSVYVSDFYSFLIQHNPTPSVERGGFKAINGAGNAFVSDLRDTEKARLWRISHPGGEPSPVFSLSKDDPQTLLKAITSPNLLWRNHATRLLVERGNRDVVPDLQKIARDPGIDAVGTNGGAFAALWALRGLGAVDDETLASALKHPASGVRRTAAKLLPRSESGTASLLASNHLADPDALVRLNALLVLSEMPASEKVGAMLHELRKDPAIREDKWLPTAITIAAGKHAFGYLSTSLTQQGTVAHSTGYSPPAAAENPNLMPNPGFEKIKDGHPEKWRPATYGGKGIFQADTSVKRSGASSALISSVDGADVGYATDLTLERDAEYEWSGWIKTENLVTTRGGKGAMLEIHSLNREQPHTKPLKGNVDWTEVKMRFSTGPQSKVTFNLLFGGWGFATGKMWVDDVDLRLITKSSSTLGPVRQVAAALAVHGTPEQRQAIETMARGQATFEIAQTILAAFASAGKEQKIETLDDLKNSHQILTLKTILGSMKYDLAELKAKSGRPIAIDFHNPDALQHNVIVGQPGSFEELNKESLKMMTAPDGLSKAWIPASPKILAQCRMLDANQRAILKLPALVPGRYPYFCTFPGHSAIMRGELIVE